MIATVSYAVYNGVSFIVTVYVIVTASLPHLINLVIGVEQVNALYCYCFTLSVLCFSFGCSWRVTLLCVRMPTRYCILGTKMILLDLLCGMRVKWVLELDHSINICTSSSVLHSCTGTTIQGSLLFTSVSWWSFNRKNTISWSFVLTSGIKVCHKCWVYFDDCYSSNTLVPISFMEFSLYYDKYHIPNVTQVSI